RRLHHRRTAATPRRSRTDSRSQPLRHREVRAHPRVLRALLEATGPDLLRTGRVARQVVRQPERGLRVDEGRLHRHDALELLAGLERAARLDQEASEPIAKIVELGAELDRT